MNFNKYICKYIYFKENYGDLFLNFNLKNSFRLKLNKFVSLEVSSVLKATQI